MDIQRCRDSVIDGVEEFAKLAAAMAPVTFSDDCACLHIQSGEPGTSCRGVCNRGCGVRSGRAAWATAAGSDPAPESVIFHQHTGPAPDPEAQDGARRCRVLCQ